MRMIGNIIQAISLVVFWQQYIKSNTKICRHAIAALFLGVALSACQTAAPVNRPCGVIIDSLRDVTGKTPADTRRIDVHFERGVAAGCWKRP